MAWGCPITDVRGETLLEWAISLGLSVLNRGSVHTCVRQSGGSVVDVSFASPAVARRVRGWKVMDGVETLSDHRYIRFDVSTLQGATNSVRSSRNSSATPRWVLSRLDRDLLCEAAIVQSWIPNPSGHVDVESEATWFREAMTQICDSSMPRARPFAPRRQVYWWSEEIAALRVDCVAVRRRYTRYRRRRHRESEVEAQLYGAYTQAKQKLQLSIEGAKESSWEELVESLNQDPWGRPYRWVRGKLQPWSPPLTQTLEPGFLEVVVSSLFPERAEHRPPSMAPPAVVADADEVPEITQAELGAAELRLRLKNTAPGPDGIPGRAWVLSLRALGPRLSKFFDACLGQGCFPQQWRSGRLVLLRKEGRPVESPSAYRPIVLLDEVGKLFERIIAARLVKHLSRVGPDLSDSQFGFRVGRSTVDAILRVKSVAEEVVSGGGVVLAISLDIANAFNTLPWSCVREALRYHQVPPYLQRIIGAYLHDRSVSYEGRDGPCVKRVSCGVPQGSVLGPLLWNIGYDWTLRGDYLPGVSLTCYADDTLVLARERTYSDAARLATAGVAQIVQRIRMLGLEVALTKSEALCFHGPRRAPPLGSHIVISGVRIKVESSMRYLGLVIDSRWRFDAHFQRLVPRVMGAAAALGRLLPNLKGPNSGCRRLYMGIIRSMVLYGSPVWSSNLTVRGAALLRKPQRAMAIRAIRGYRTVSGEAACALAGSLPWDLDARILASLYEWRKENGGWIAPRMLERQRAALQGDALEIWRGRLMQPGAGLGIAEALHPVLSKWVGRRHGLLTFRLTQVLSGHGCFGKYLCRVAGREPDSRCHHCGDCREDTAQHTLEQCSAWVEQRRILIAEVGGDLSLPAVVQTMVESESSWQAVATFCEDVISQKEAAEREREITSTLPIRTRRTGRRRRRDNALFRPP